MGDRHGPEAVQHTDYLVAIERGGILSCDRRGQKARQDAKDAYVTFEHG